MVLFGGTITVPIQNFFKQNPEGEDKKITSKSRKDNSSSGLNISDYYKQLALNSKENLVLENHLKKEDIYF